MTTNDQDTQDEGAETAGVPERIEASASPAGVPPVVPPAPKEKPEAPKLGEDGYTIGDKPEQVAADGENPEAELTKKRAAAPAQADAKEPHQTKAAHEKWALHFGMLPMMLEEAVIKWKSAKAIPGKMNPKFDAYNKAKAHGNWAPHFEVTEAEFQKAVADANAHVYGSPARSPQN